MSEHKFKVTYSTLASPDPLLDQMFDEAVARVRANMGQTFPMYINGEERFASQTFTKISPVDLDMVMAHFQKVAEEHANDAVAAAKAACPGWRDVTATYCSACVPILCHFILI